MNWERLRREGWTAREKVEYIDGKVEQCLREEEVDKALELGCRQINW